MKNFYRCHYSVSNKALGIWGNEELRREGQYRGIPRCKKAVFKGEGLLTYTWIITEMNHPTSYSKGWFMMIWSVHPAPDPPGGGGVLLGNLGEGEPPCSPNPVHISDQKCHFPHPFSAQISKIHTHFQSWPNLACSRFSDSGGDSPVSARFIFVFALSQFSGPNNFGAWNRLGIIGQEVCHHY